MFIFPAGLKHWVFPFKSDCTRVSVSGNVGDSIKIKHLKNYIEEENKKKGEKNEQNNSKENNKKTV